MALENWGMLTRAERDAAYDNGAAVANRNELVQIRDAQGASYRAAHPDYLNLPYAEKERTKWDLFPAMKPGAPCLVFIHGGYWQMNTRENFSGLAAGMAEVGWSVAFPGYTLCPQASLSQIVAELRSALTWLGTHGPEHGIAGKIYLSGWSAGGHLTAMLLDHDCVTAGLAISGLYELGPMRDTYLDEKLQLSDEEIISLSPVRLPIVQKRLVIAYGTAELPVLIRESRDFHAHRAAGHADGALIPIPHANHFDILESLRASDGILARCIAAMAQ